MCRYVLDCCTGELEHRIVDEGKRAPWKYWVPMADPKRSREEKLSAAQDLMAADERELDSASSHLRRRVARAEELLEPHHQRLLFHGVNSIVLSTAFIECLFGQYGQWLRKSPKPLGLALLAAKHTTHQFSVGAERKRKRQLHDDGSADPPKTRCTEVMRRPAWVFKRGEQARRNARHQHISTEVASRGLILAS